MSDTFIAELPDWQALGTQPSVDKKQQGFQVDESPAAGHFDWFFNRVYLALKEFQDAGASLDDLDTLNLAITNAMSSNDTKAQGYAITAEGNAKGYADTKASAVQTNLDTHKADKTNPHGTTKTHVGLGNVQNYGIASKVDAETGTSDAVYMTALKVAQAIVVLQAIKSVNGKTGIVSLSAGDVGSYTKTESDTNYTPKSHVGASGAAAHPDATTVSSGFMTAADKTKLNNVEVNANNYVHPANHPPSIIAQDADNRFTTDAEKTNWNGKAGTTVATQAANGLMSSGDKTKLDGVAANANNYAHPTGDGNQHVPATGTANNAKVLKAGATAGSAAWASVGFSELTGKPTTLGGYGITDATPSSHLTNTANPHSVTAAQVGAYTKAEADTNYTPKSHVGASGTAAHPDATTVASGFMPAADKVKLNGISTGAEVNQNAFANFLVGVTTIAADAESDTLELVATAPLTITPDATNDKLIFDVSNVTQTADGLMIAADKAKLDGIATNANNYTHPTGDGSSHVPATGTTNNAKVLKAGSTANSAAWGVVNASEVVQDASNRFVSDAEKTTWNGKASTAVATQTVDGLMDNTDKVKLDGIATNANNYIHPATHPPSIIVQDASNRFVTDAEKTTWNGKASTAVVTTGANGLMLAADKTKLDGIAAGAEVNQNAFAAVLVGGNTLAADSETDSLQIIAGDGIALTSDATNDNFTISLAIPTWINLTLQNGAVVSLTRTPRYTKIGKEIILEGEIANIAAGTTIATLPTGFRPPSPRGFKVAHNSSASNDGVTIYVDITGAVVINAVANATNGISLNGVRFFVD